MLYTEEKKQFRIYFLALLVVAAFVLGMFMERKSSAIDNVGTAVSGDSDLSQTDLKLLEEVWGIMKKKYVEKNPNKKEAVEGAARGLVSAFGDPYTVFWDEEEADSFVMDMEGSFEGIGAEIGIQDQMLTVISPLDDMPAERVGLKPGDVILKINDEATSEMTLDEALQKIRGPKGTKVKLTIFREDDSGSDPFEVEIERDIIDIKSVKWEEKDGVIYFRVSGFLKDTEEELSKAIKEFRGTGNKKIVLDLRNNPGGYLEEAIDIAGHFLERGSLVVREDYGEKNANLSQERFSKGDGELKDYQLVILINKGSASSSEILAGALRDNREDVQLVGQTTFGKGSVQEIEGLKAGQAIKVTIAKWLTPSGGSIDKEGIKPDVEVENSTGNLAAGIDDQYQKAVEILKSGS